jgi:hypothetical protein
MKECHDGRRNVMCFQRRFLLLYSKCWISGRGQAGWYEGRGQRHSEGVKGKGRYLMEEWTILLLWCL